MFYGCFWVSLSVCGGVFWSSLVFSRFLEMFVGVFGCS